MSVDCRYLKQHPLTSCAAIVLSADAMKMEGSSAVRWFVLGALAGVCVMQTPAWAGKLPVSELVVDAQTGRHLHAVNVDQPRPSASLTKMMTLLLVFDALAEGRLKSGDRLAMTAEGARQPPSRLGMAIGDRLSIRGAIRSVAVISANDVAVALADRLAGSEARFVALMNRKARQIGMRNTHFGNATGLPVRSGWSTARDLAVLSRYLIERHPDRYRLFGTRSIRWEGRVRPNHNQLLGKVAGLDGIKTGYTANAGFKLAASARRSGKRVVVIVLGAGSASSSDLLVANLLKAVFTSGARTASVVTRGGQRHRPA